MSERSDRFCDCDERPVVFVSNAANLDPDDSRKLIKKYETSKVLEILNEEKKNSIVFDKAWNEAAAHLKIGPNLTFNDHLKIAVCCYTVQLPLLKKREQFYFVFNKRCLELTTENWDVFPYKSMWIMLREAMSNDEVMNSPTPSEYSKLYRGLSFHIRDTPRVGDLLYSKQFISTSTHLDVARKFADDDGRITENKTIIEIYGEVRSGKGIASYSIYRSEGEVLISPWQKFEVISVETSETQHKICVGCMD